MLLIKLWGTALMPCLKFLKKLKQTNKQGEAHPKQAPRIKLG